MPLQREAVALDRVIRSTVAKYEALASPDGIHLTLELATDLPRTNVGQDRLIQVLTNLLDNAFKFTPLGGRVTVHGEETHEEIQFLFFLRKP